jgi:hypothetical protein
MATMQGRGEIATPHAFERYGGVSISATETSATPQLLNCLGDQYVVSNTSSTLWVHVQWGESGVVATTASQAVPPGAQATYTIPYIDAAQTNRGVYVTALTNGEGTAVVQISRGIGS